MPPGALRLFPLERSSGKPKVPDGVVVTYTGRGQFPHVLESGEGRRTLRETTPAGLRERFAYYLNDADKGRFSVLYIVAPLDTGKTRLQPVPFKWLRYFYDDVAFDWASFADGDVPPQRDCGAPLFDPRFVQSALAKPTAADIVSASAEAEAAPTGDGDVEMVPVSVEEKPKPKAQAKPKAKAKVAAKPRAKAAAKSRGKAAPEPKEIVIDPVVGEVYPYEKEDVVGSDDISKYKMWCGGENVYADPASVLSAATGMVPGITRCENLCKATG